MTAVYLDPWHVVAVGALVAVVLSGAVGKLIRWDWRLRLEARRQGAEAARLDRLAVDLRRREASVAKQEDLLRRRHELLLAGEEDLRRRSRRVTPAKGRR